MPARPRLSILWWKQSASRAGQDLPDRSVISQCAQQAGDLPRRPKQISTAAFPRKLLACLPATQLALQELLQPACGCLFAVAAGGCFCQLFLACE